MPVTAPLEANLRLAAMLGRRVTVFVPGDAGERVQYEELATLYGLRGVIASIVPVDLGYPPERELARMMAEDRPALVSAILGCHQRFINEQLEPLARRAVDEDGAGILYLGCTLWSGMAAGAASAVGMSVLDPGLGALRAAEALADVQAA
jgi:Asp/Glu/hydantoin racemase